MTHTRHSPHPSPLTSFNACRTVPERHAGGAPAAPQRAVWHTEGILAHGALCQLAHVCRNPDFFQKLNDYAFLAE